MNITQGFANVSTTDYDFDIYNSFFRLNCIQKVELSNYDEVDNDAVRLLNEIFSSLIGQWQIQSQVVNVLSYITLVMFTQVGGIPVPGKNKVDNIFYWVWMILNLAQVVIVPLAIVTSVMGYVNLRLITELSPCAVKWSTGVFVIDAVFIQSFPFQPTIMFPLILCWIYMSVFQEGIKIYRAANKENETTGGCWTYVNCIAESIIDLPFMMFRMCDKFCADGANTDEKVENENRSFIFEVTDKIIGMVIILAVLSVLLWGISLSFLFSFIFFPLFLLSIMFVSLITLCISVINKYCTREVYSENIIGELLERTAHMTWWSNFDFEEEEGKKEKKKIAVLNTTSAFLKIIDLSYLIMFSPFIVFGIWLSSYVYANTSMGNNKLAIEYIYRLVWGCLPMDTNNLQGDFIECGNMPLAISLNLGDAQKTLSNILKTAIHGFGKLSVVELFQLARGYTLVVLILSFLKLFLSLLQVLMNTYLKVGGKPMPFHEVVRKDINGLTRLLKDRKGFELELPKTATETAALAL